MPDLDNQEKDIKSSPPPPPPPLPKRDDKILGAPIIDTNPMNHENGTCEEGTSLLPFLYKL